MRYARDIGQELMHGADVRPGKSSITLRLVRSQWTSDYDPTIGARHAGCAQDSPTNSPLEDSYSVTRTIDGVPYYLMLTDTAGQEEYRGLWAASNLNSDAFLLVYDITSPNSLDALEYFMEMIDMEEESRIDNGKTPPVKIVAGNKCDLQGQRQIKAKDGLEWARRRRCGFMETSAREMVNIEETFARTSMNAWRVRWVYLDNVLTIVVLVRRVVEARRQAAGDAAGNEPYRTAALPPPKANEPSSQTPNEKDDQSGRESFWRKLKCW
jgi:GTPase KRas protein